MPMLQSAPHPYFKSWAKKYNSPLKVQDLIYSLKYNTKDTLQSAKTTLKNKTAHCLEGAFVAAAILEHHGYPPLVLSFESQDGVDHVLFVFQQKNKWGAIGQSRDKGLHGRAPVFRSLRDLTWSYFDPYIDKTGKITAYQKANLDDSGGDWRMSSRNVWKTENYLLKIPHIKLIASKKRYKKMLNYHLTKGDLPAESYWW